MHVLSQFFYNSELVDRILCLQYQNTGRSNHIEWLSHLVQSWLVEHIIGDS